ncbi:MAG: T9SS type A sorting domain-containing protein [Salinivirgaceae bacterium]|nr:T9SS type A sorting domain-containing protein [Salinivirgaceae bacterium]
MQICFFIKKTYICGVTLVKLKQISIMRKFTLVISMLAMGSFVFGQQMDNVQHRLSKMTENSVETTTQSSKRDVIGAGDIIFSETFDSTDWHTAIDDNLVAIPANMPNGWTAYDATGNNFFIRWSTTGARGAYTSPSSGTAALVDPCTTCLVYSTSDEEGDRGFLLLELDFYNTMPNGNPVNPSIAMDTYVQTRAIDASANGAVSIYLEQNHRFCCAPYEPEVGPKLMVSTNLTDWTTYRIDQAAINATPKENPSVLEISLSSVAANQSTVYLRFHLKGHEAYYWSMDDVSLYEPMPYDTRMEGFWVDYFKEDRVPYSDANYGKGYNGIPYFGAYSAFQPLVKGRAMAGNFGASQGTNLTLTTKVLKGTSQDENPEELFSATSTPLPLHALGALDTVEVDLNYQIAREVASVGAYHVKGILAMAEEDNVPENNTGVFDFNITENILNYINPTYAHTDRSSPFGYVGSADGDGVGSLYHLNPPTEVIDGTSIPAPHTAEGINVFIARDGYNREIWRAGGVAYLTPTLYEAAMIDGAWDFDDTNATLVGDAIAIDSLMESTWVFLPFNKDGATELLTPAVEGHQYMAMVRFTIGDIVDGGRFWIGADKYTQANYNSLQVAIGEGFGWSSGTKGVSMELMVNPYGVNPKGGAKFMIEMETKGVKTPAEGAILVFHTQDGDNTAVATEYTVDPTGMVETMDTLRMGTYSYTLKWTTAEDEPKQLNGRVSLNQSGIKIVNLIINADNTVGIEAPTMELSMYPNPANNSVTVESNVATSRIVVSNIVGQVVDVINNPATTQTISVSNYATGVYMVTIVDNEGNKVTKRLIKQ